MENNTFADEVHKGLITICTTINQTNERLLNHYMRDYDSCEARSRFNQHHQTKPETLFKVLSGSDEPRKYHQLHFDNGMLRDLKAEDWLTINYCFSYIPFGEVKLSLKDYIQEYIPNNPKY